MLLQCTIDALLLAIKAGRWIEVQGLARNIEWHAQSAQNLKESLQSPEGFPDEESPD